VASPTPNRLIKETDFVELKASFHLWRRLQAYPQTAFRRDQQIRGWR
jgi:hypothetical protein